MKKMVISFQRMYVYLKSCLFRWGIGSLCDVVGLGIFSVLTAAALEDFINAVSEMQIALLYAGLKRLGLAVLVMFLFEGLYKWLFFSAMSQVKVSMQKDLFRKFMAMPCSLGEEGKVAGKMTHLTQDVDTSMGFIGENFISFLGSFVMVFVSVFCIGAKNWILGMVCMALVVAIIAINFIYQPKQQEITAKIISKNEELNAVFMETLNGGITVRTNRLQPFVRGIFQRKAQELLSLKKTERNMDLAQGLWGNGLSKLMVLLILVMGAWLCSAGKMKVGSLFFIFQFSLNLVGYAGQLCGSFITLSKAQAGVGRFFEILGSAEESEFYGDEEPMSGGISISLRDVRVKFSDRAVFDGLCADFSTGEYVAVAGESGAGKSTLLNVLLGFTAYGGSYTINGKDAKEYSLAGFRGLFSLVPQKPEIFSCSIRENIAYGKPGASEEEIIEAARMAGADKFIGKYPDGYDTVIAENGGNLSGGEKQRIALARALIKDAPILLLDEFTSSLDSETENEVRAALEKVKGDKLVIMVAHRESMINVAGRVMTIYPCM